MSSYVDHHGFGRREDHGAPDITHSWKDHTHRRLIEQYGVERANRIIAGQDPKTQADVQRWNMLGRRSVA